MSETPEEVVARELELWRLSQRDPDIMNGETLEEAGCRRAYVMELQEMKLRYDKQVADWKRDIQRRMNDEFLAAKWEHRLWENLYVPKNDYMAYCFPRITWRDLWLAIRGY